MPPRLGGGSARAVCSLTRASPATQPRLRSLRLISTSSSSQYAAALATPLSNMSFRLPADYVPPTKPPSARPPETRKAQLIRSYTSLLRSTPLILFFQHNNITAVEWAALRRELNRALAAVAAPAGDQADIATNIHIQVLRTRMFNMALKVVEFFDPEQAAVSSKTARSTKGPLVHDLSAAAYETIREVPVPEDSSYAQISPLLTGPLAALVFPAVSPAHLAAALRILAPSPPRFPAPTRKANPGYHDPQCQSALAKLLLIGGRIEDKVFDTDGVKWVGGIEGGLDGLRAQLVYLLQGAGLGLTSTLEAGGKSLWLTLEGRRGMLEEEQSGEKKGEQAENKEAEG